MKKYRVLKAIDNFWKKYNMLKVRLGIVLFSLSYDNDHRVKAILLYKISVFLLKNKSSVKAISLYKITFYFFKILDFLEERP